MHTVRGQPDVASINIAGRASWLFLDHLPDRMRDAVVAGPACRSINKEGECTVKTPGANS